MIVIVGYERQKATTVSYPAWNTYNSTKIIGWGSISAEITSVEIVNFCVRESRKISTRDRDLKVFFVEIEIEIEIGQWVSRRDSRLKKRSRSRSRRDRDLISHMPSLNYVRRQRLHHPFYSATSYLCATSLTAAEQCTQSLIAFATHFPWPLTLNQI